MMVSATRFDKVLRGIVRKNRAGYKDTMCYPIAAMHKMHSILFSIQDMDHPNLVSAKKMFPGALKNTAATIAKKIVQQLCASQ